MLGLIMRCYREFLFPFVKHVLGLKRLIIVFRQYFPPTERDLEKDEADLDDWDEIKREEVSGEERKELDRKTDEMNVKNLSKV